MQGSTEQDPVRTRHTDEREFRLYSDRFYKRCYRPGEYVPDRRGFVHTPAQPVDRLRNEAACLQLVRARTSVPVPRVLEAYEDDGSFVLVTERVSGRDVEELTPEERALVTAEVEGYAAELKQLRSRRPGGPTGLMCPPPRAADGFGVDAAWRPKVADKGSGVDYGFCHNDLSWSNIFVDGEVARVKAIVDWEYAGYWPEVFEMPYYLDTKMPAEAQFREAPEWKRMKEFLMTQL